MGGLEKTRGKQSSKWYWKKYRNGQKSRQNSVQKCNMPLWRMKSNLSTEYLILSKVLVLQNSILRFYWITTREVMHSISIFMFFSEDDDSFSLPTLAKDNSHNSSFELIGSMIPSYQPCNKQMSRGGNFLSAAGGFRSPSPGFFKTSFISSASKVKFSDLLPSHTNSCVNSSNE